MSTLMTRIDPGRDLIASRDETDALVLNHLRGLAGAHGVATASNRDLAAALPISPATARRAVARLIDTGAIELVARGTGGRYRSRFRISTSAHRPAGAA